MLNSASLTSGVHRAIILKLPQAASPQLWESAFKYAQPLERTVTSSLDDLLSMLAKGNVDSYAELAEPTHPGQLETMAELDRLGLKWVVVNLSHSLLSSPVSGNLHITSHFNARRSYLPPYHEGLDFRAALGSTVRNSLGGIVTKVRETDPGGYGKYVRIESRVNETIYIIWYAHLSQVSVRTGEQVPTGKIIGFAGHSGNATGSHLHVTVQKLPGGLNGYIVPSVVDPGPLFGLPATTLPGPPASNASKRDLLPYLKGDGRIYEVQHMGGGNSPGPTETFQTQTQGSDIFYQVKNHQYEKFRVDTQFIWRGLDTSPGPAPEYAERPGQNRFYIQRDPGSDFARWCPRRMAEGELFVGQPHHVQFYYKEDCQLSSANSGPASNRIKFIKHHSNSTKAWNGIILNDLIELTTDRWPLERYWYARNYGLVAWSYEELDTAGNIVIKASSAISEIHQNRPPNDRENIPCLDN